MNKINDSRLGDKMTFEDLLIYKQELMEERARQHQVLMKRYRDVTAPFSFSSFPGTLVKRFTTGFAIFDGLLIGFKFIRRIFRFFK